MQISSFCYKKVHIQLYNFVVDWFRGNRRRIWCLFGQEKYLYNTLINNVLYHILKYTFGPVIRGFVGKKLLRTKNDQVLVIQKATCLRKMMFQENMFHFRQVRNELFKLQALGSPAHSALGCTQCKWMTAFQALNSLRFSLSHLLTLSHSHPLTFSPTH